MIIDNRQTIFFVVFINYSFHNNSLISVCGLMTTTLTKSASTFNVSYLQLKYYDLNSMLLNF